MGQEGEFYPMSDVILSLLEKKGWRKGKKILRWRSWWKMAVGPFIAGKSEITGARQDLAIVAVEDGILLSELALQKDLILKKLREIGRDEAPSDLYFRVDPSLSNLRKDAPKPPAIDQATEREIEHLLSEIEDQELKELFRHILTFNLAREK